MAKTIELTDDQFKTLLRRLPVAECVKVISYLERRIKFGKKQAKREFLERPISDMNISVRVFNCLASAGLHTAGDVVYYFHT